MPLYNHKIEWGEIVFSVSVDLQGLDAALLAATNGLTQAVRAEMKQQLTEIQREARKTHRYGKGAKSDKIIRQKRGYRLTGKLPMSVNTLITDNGLTGEVYLESSIAPYGIYVHEGHHLPPMYKGPGWAPDRFLDEALEKQEPKIQPAFQHAVEAALRRAIP